MAFSQDMAAASGRSSFKEDLPLLREEGEIVRRVLAGRVDEFETLVLRYEKGIFLHVWRIVRNREDAEDIAQEAFAKAFSALGGFDRKRPFKPWLYRIAANLAVSSLRRARPVVSLDENNGGADALASDETDPREQAESALRKETLAKALLRLPRETQALIALRYEEDLAIAEIATILERKPTAVKTALHRARLKLREIVFGRRAK